MGFSDRKITFAGAGPVGSGTPWGTIGEITARLLSPRGYDVTIETRSSQMNNARYVADGRADIGATHVTQLRGAYGGLDLWAPEGPRPNLRVLANVNHPSWLALAVREESGITDLSQIVDQKLPLRVRASKVLMCRIVCDHYGLTPERLADQGGYLLAPSDYPSDEVDFMAASAATSRLVPWVESGDFDVIIDTIYAAHTPEVRHFTEAVILHNLRFLPVPPALQEKIEQAGLGPAGVLPHRLVRGLTSDVASVIRLPHAIYCRDDAPDEFVTDVVGALDVGRAAFRSVHIPFSIDPLDMAHEHGVPLHPAARRYYEGVGYSLS